MKSLDVLVSKACNSQVTSEDLLLDKLLQTSDRSLEAKDLRQLPEMCTLKVSCQPHLVERI